MKIKKYVIMGLTALFLLFFTLPVLAASSDFLPQATQFFNRYCSMRRIPDAIAVSCYLFEKVQEQQTDLDFLKQRADRHEYDIATQSAKIVELEERIAALEGDFQSCLELPLNLLSWWTGDGNANDIAGGNDGTFQNGASVGSGKVDQAFSFDGNDDFVQASTNGLPTSNSNRTLDLWVKIKTFLADIPNPQSPLETFFAGYGNFGSSGQVYALGTAGNVLYFSQWGSAIFGPSLVVDTWYHVAVTNEGNSAKLYLNGAEVASGDISINTPNDTNFYIGRVAGSLGDIRRLDGLVDEVEIFDRALSQAEIQALYEADSRGKCK